MACLHGTLKKVVDLCRRNLDAGRFPVFQQVASEDVQPSDLTAEYAKVIGVRSLIAKQRQPRLERIDGRRDAEERVPGLMGHARDERAHPDEHFGPLEL